MISAGGQEFTYLPISLVAGEESTPLRVTVTVPRVGDLRAIKNMMLFSVISVFAITRTMGF